MAERRMFAKTIIDSDAFLDMPSSTQSLYFHLSMRADDDGFINNPKKIMRMIGASQNELELLLGKKFIIGFESGVIVIKHWKIHNYIRNDRYNPTNYVDEKALLTLKKNKSYSLDTDGIPLVDHLDTQVRLGKDSKGKDSKDNCHNKVGDDETKVKFGETSFEIQLTDYLIGKIKEELPNAITPDINNLADKQKWAVYVDRMRRLDKRTDEDIKKALRYATTDSFWKTNILSTKKLRDKFDTLYAQSNKRPNNKANTYHGQLDMMKEWANGE